MCGRYTLYAAPHKLKDLFSTENLPNFGARYNAAPLQNMPVIVKNKLGFARWGLLPPWAQTDDTLLCATMINARAESVSRKRSFAESWRKGRRCLIPANGFYEWYTDKICGTKQPYYITHKYLNCFAFAGLWSKHDDLVTFTILTKDADGDIADLHHRMPVIFTPFQNNEWFENDLTGAEKMITQTNGKNLMFHPVSPDVGKVTNDDPNLIAPVRIQTQTVMNF